VKIAVTGLWHLGCVTAACLAEHYDVVAHDRDGAVVDALREGRPPLYEPGLSELLAEGVRGGRLRFTSDASEAARDAEVLWIAHDTPVDERDVPDVDFVARAVEEFLPLLRPGTLVVVASQVPVGFVARMERRAAELGVAVTFASCPENLRLGNALEIYRRPDRIVAGVRTDADRARLGSILAPFSANVVWMSPESSEMTKHALNAFLATSVTFINEIAGICESVGADVKDVERGLKSESRIGPRAYLSAGSGFAGGTLARDVRALIGMELPAAPPRNVLAGVLETNELQRQWAERVLERELGELRGARIAILGLTYKPGTDTLRRSDSVALGKRLHERGVTVSAYDPAVRTLPDDAAASISLAGSAEGALTDADAVVIGTAWPEFLELDAAGLTPMRAMRVLDPQRVLEARLREAPGVRYFGVGLPRPESRATPAGPDANDAMQAQPPDRRARTGAP